MVTLHLRTAAAAAAALLVSLSAAADPVDPDASLRRLRDENQLRSDWGVLAQARSGAAPVKALGKTLVNDHRELDQALADYAAANGIDLGPRKTLAPPAWSAYSGTTFDVAFLSAVSKSNDEMISLLVKAREETFEPQLRRLINHALATYRGHQREVARVWQELVPLT